MSKKKKNTSSNTYTPDSKYSCEDIPHGFQDINPQLFVLIGEILGNSIAGRIPFNVQNALGNWLQLVGQAILVYNAQQQYFQGGPGRYFDPEFFNISNPFCPSTSGTTEGNSSSGAVNSSQNSTEEEIEEEEIEITSINKRVSELLSELNEIKSKLDKLDM